MSFYCIPRKEWEISKVKEKLHFVNLEILQMTNYDVTKGLQYMTINSPLIYYRNHHTLLYTHWILFQISRHVREIPNFGQILSVNLQSFHCSLVPFPNLVSIRGYT